MKMDSEAVESWNEKGDYEDLGDQSSNIKEVVSKILK